MNPPVVNIERSDKHQDWTDVAMRLAQEFSARASDHDVEGNFVHQNYADLRELQTVLRRYSGGTRRRRSPL